MKKTEQIIASVIVIALGVLLIALQGDVISILMTVAGIALVAFGIVDLISCLIPPAVIKIVIGGLLVLCGWILVEAVLYVLAAALLILGILLIYEKIKTKACNIHSWQGLLEYAIPVFCILTGILFFFNNGNEATWVFIVGGAFTVAQGSLLLVNAFFKD